MNLVHTELFSKVKRWTGIFKVDWMHLNNRSLLTNGHFKLTRNSRMKIDKKDYTTIGVR